MGGGGIIIIGFVTFMVPVIPVVALWLVHPAGTLPRG